MHSNLASARQSIQAELAHAREGIAFYMERVEALENALSQLEHVEEGLDVDRPPKRGKTGQRTRGADRGEAKNGRTAGDGRRTSRKEAAGATGKTRRAGTAKSSGGAKTESALPKTGIEFWLELVTESPKTAVDIANAAVSRLGLAANQREQIQKLKQRVAPALASLVKAGRIEDSGSGRDRRYTKSGSQQQLH